MKANASIFCITPPSAGLPLSSSFNEPVSHPGDDPPSVVSMKCLHFAPGNNLIRSTASSALLRASFYDSGRRPDVS